MLYMIESKQTPQERVSANEGYTMAPDGFSIWVLKEANCIPFPSFALLGPAIITGYEKGPHGEETGLGPKLAKTLIKAEAEDISALPEIVESTGGYPAENGYIIEPVLIVSFPGQGIDDFSLSGLAIRIREGLRQGSVIAISQDGRAVFL